MEASKLQRHYFNHCRATIRSGAEETDVLIPLGTQTAILTQDWLRITMEHMEGCD